MSEDWPAVSIVVPTLNSKETIKSCLSSIMRQDYPKDNFDVIIVDGGSRDNTLDVVTECPAEIVIESRRGRGVTYNRGFQEAKGDYVAFLDSDAIAPTSWLSNAIRILRQDTQTAVVYFRNLAPPDSSYFQKCVDTLLSKSWGQANGAVYRKSALNKIGGFNVSLRYLQEDEAGIRLLRQGYNFRVVDKPAIWHYPRKSFKSYISQCVESGTGSFKLSLIVNRPYLFVRLFLRALVAIFPLLTIALLALFSPFAWIIVLGAILGVTIYSIYLWHATSLEYRSVEYILPATFLMWISTLANLFGYVISLFED